MWTAFHKTEIDSKGTFARVIAVERSGERSPRRPGLGALALAKFSRSYAVLPVFWNDGSDSSITTHGNLSSSQTAFRGANGAGSSSDAIVTSVISESLVDSKNR
jgi:hypothetical protein